jgi:ABC-type multidrug transport system ATPase subunit
MKQRLGLAQALLHDPELIILDEPTTGLDPQGMKEIRDLIIHLSKEKNKTIFLSSHILHEVEIVADRMIIISRGSAQVEGSVNDLLNANKLKVTVEVNDIEKTRALLNETVWGSKLDTINNTKLVFDLQAGESALLNNYLVNNGIEVSAIIPRRSLEEYFLNITEKEK